MACPYKGTLTLEGLNQLTDGAGLASAGVDMSRLMGREGILTHIIADHQSIPSVTVTVGSDTVYQGYMPRRVPVPIAGGVVDAGTPILITLAGTPAAPAVVSLIVEE